MPVRTSPQESDVNLMGVPILGGFIDSVIGIITGAINGIAPQPPGILQALGVPG